MRRRLLTGLSLGSLAGLLLVLPLSHCFNPDLPTCSFRCGTDPMCPEQYECRSDGYCHLLGTTEACPFTADLLPGPDLLVPAPDGGGNAGDGGDGGTAGDAAGVDGK